MKHIDTLRRNLPRSTYGNPNPVNPNYNGTYDADFERALVNAWKLLDAMAERQDTSPATLTTMLQALAIVDADNAAAYGQFIHMLASGRPY